MLRLPPFRHVAARTVQEAVGVLASEGPSAMVLAGGTDLIPGMKRRLYTPGVVVGLRGVGEIQGLGEGRIGAGVTLARLARDPMVCGLYPALAEAAGLAATPAIRMAATLGGNLCLDTRCSHFDQTLEWRSAEGFCMKKDGTVCRVAPGSDRCWAVSASDTAPVAIALGARVVLAGPGGERTIEAEDLYQDDGARPLARRADEVMREVLLPPPDGWRCVYLKARRRGAIDFALASVAVAVRGAFEDARVVLGAVGSRPVRVREAEAAIARGDMEGAARLAAHAARPLDNTDLDNAYRKKVVPVLVRRALAGLGGIDG